MGGISNTINDIPRPLLYCYASLARDGKEHFLFRVFPQPFAAPGSRVILAFRFLFQQISVGLSIRFLGRQELFVLGIF